MAHGPTVEPALPPSVAVAPKRDFIHGLLALIVLVLGALAYPVLNSKDHGPWPRLLALLLMVVALTTLALNVARGINLQRTSQPQAQGKQLANYAIAITIKGNRRTVQPITVPFQVGSGQVNFGCQETARPSATYTVPEGAHDVNATAQWINTANVKYQNQEAQVTGRVSRPME